MPLPKIAAPTYELVIPSTQKKIKYRPFLVKEEKILILAMESEDSTQIANAVKDIISNCITSRGVKVDELATFDIEYIFLNIRGKSVGESVEVLVTCPDDGQTKVPVVIELDDIQIQDNEEHNRDINLGQYTMRMKYPSMDQFVKNNFVSEKSFGVDDTFELITMCIEQIYNQEESWSAKDSTKKELLAFIEQLTSNQFKEVEKFFQTMPKLSHTFTVTNPNTNVESEVVLEGLTSFFG